jgi:hypothetical protein
MTQKHKDPQRRRLHLGRLAILAVVITGARGEIIDRVVAAVGRRVITRSDVQREAQLEAYFDGRPPAPAGEHRETLERLLRQHLIQHEMDQLAFPLPDPTQVKKRLAAMRPAGRNPADYGLNEQDLLEYAGRVDRTDRFLNLRFGGQEDREIEERLKELRSRLRVRIIETEKP